MKNAEPGPVLLYDGVCGFCDRLVRMVFRADRPGRFRFAPLQGQYAADVKRRHPELDHIDSLVLVEGAGDAEHVTVRSEALLRLARLLGGRWRLALTLELLPRRLRDSAYDAFARRRQRIFGRYDVCPVPPPQMRSRFLE
jgi:predicted DCC family thiol-disulfide oxidoreductase YuxK